MQLDCSLLQAFSLGKPVVCVRSQGNCRFYVFIPIRFFSCIPELRFQRFYSPFLFKSWAHIFAQKLKKTIEPPYLDKKIDYDQRIK